MTLQVQPGFTYVDVSAAAIDAFVAAGAGTLTLSVTHNCATPVDTVIVANDLTDGVLRVVPAHVDQTGVRLEDGIYRIALTHSGTPTKTADETMLFVDYDLVCKLLAYYAEHLACLERKPCHDTEQFYPLAFADLLRRGRICTDFTYEQACSVYAYLTDLLTQDYDCGCH